MSSGIERKLTTILAADAEGFSREMRVDEARTFDALHDARNVFTRFIERHRGRIANTAGDGLIAEFPSVVEAVQCAIEVQNELNGRDGVLRFRIGVHLGDVMVDGDDLLGEGVNLAARLQSMAEPGGILISQQVYDQVHTKLSVGFDFLGEKRPKNFGEDVRIYSVSPGRKRWRESSRPKVAPMSPPPETASEDTGDLALRVTRNARMLGMVWAGLLAVDLLTGPGLWVQWPGLAFGLILAWQAGPMMVRDGFDLMSVRSATILGMLFLVNILSWSGDLWVVWPAIAIGGLEAIRRLRNRRA